MELAATAQAFYATVAVGATNSLVTLSSGWLYGGMGASAFWVLAAMCGLAIAVAMHIHGPDAVAG